MLDQSSVGRLSRMDAMQQQAMAQTTRQRAKRTLGRIEAALKHCDEPINPRRLELDPATPLCIKCAAARGG